jgi:hypothetical protein
MTKITVTSIDTGAFYLDVHVLHANGRAEVNEHLSTTSTGVQT